MSREKFSYGQFKNKQNLQACKLKAMKIYNSLFNKMLSDIYDSYIEFSFNLYDELSSLETSEDSFFAKVVEITKSASYEKSKDRIYDYINSTEYDECEEIEIFSNLLEIVLDSHIEEISVYYTSVCNNYLMNLLRKKSEALSEEDCFKELVYLDTNFVRMSMLRFSSLFDKVKASSMYLNDIFIEECGDYIGVRLKETIVKCTVSILKEYAEVDVDDDQLGEMYSLINTEKETSEGKNPSKLEYIDDYKRLNKLAVDSGFEYVRSKGDHGIYKNNNGLVVIPQGRSIGKGLSIKIQKAIVSLSA